MQVKSIAECSNTLCRSIAILATFIKLLFVIEIFVLSILSGHFTQVLLHVRLLLAFAHMQYAPKSHGLEYYYQSIGIIVSHHLTTTGLVMSYRNYKHVSPRKAHKFKNYFS